MYVFTKKAVQTAILSLICILLAGCGDSPQPVQDTKTQGELTQQEDELSYVIMDTDLPPSEDALTQDILKDDNWAVSERESRFWNGSFYRLSWLYEITDDDNISDGACVQVLAPPCDHWENYAIFYQEEEYSDLWVLSLAGVSENGVLLEMCSREDDKNYLAQLEWNGGLEVLFEMPRELRSDANRYGQSNFWRQEDERYLAFSYKGTELTVFDKSGQRESGQDLTGSVAGFLEDPKSGELIWYGFDREELVLWDEPGGQVLARITDQIDQDMDFAVGYSPTGELFLADTDQAWIYDGDMVREAFTFLDKDYFLQELYGLAFREDGVLLLLARCDGDQCILTAEIGSGAEKQEVFVVRGKSDPTLEKLIARYNRRSREYHVTLTAAMEEQDPKEYCTRIQLEMVAGRGPDLLGDEIFDIRECVDHGYLEPLEDVVEDRALFLETALATGETDGKLYGIPYECYPYFLAVSRQLADAPSWTLEQMYEAVRRSPAESLEEGISGAGIVMAYGLRDEGNKAFIDWEKGESHLTEEPFLELMAFAKEYADQGGYPHSEVGERLANGRIAGENVVLNTPSQLPYAKACFNGEAACIGYPRESGSGIYMEAEHFYLNRNAGSKEGALDFLRYLLSEEGQLRYMEYSSIDYSFMGYSNWVRLSVRRSVVQEGLDRYQQINRNNMGQSYDSRGISYSWDELDEEQVETFWRILDNAIPAVFRADDIRSMVYEELQPYFSDERSAEEAARTLHSRVQIYLDERK